MADPYKVSYRKGKKAKVIQRVVWENSPHLVRKKFYRLFPSKFEIVAIDE